MTRQTSNVSLSVKLLTRPSFPCERLLSTEDRNINNRTLKNFIKDIAVQACKCSRPANDPRAANDPQIGPQMIPGPEMIPTNGVAKNRERRGHHE